MEGFIQILIRLADRYSGLAGVCFASVAGGIAFVADGVGFVAGGDVVPPALAVAVTTCTDICEEIPATARRRHGKIDEPYSNIENAIVALQAHPAWGAPSAVFSQLISNRTQLSTLIPKCRSALWIRKTCLMKTTITKGKEGGESSVSAKDKGFCCRLLPTRWNLYNNNRWYDISSNRRHVSLQRLIFFMRYCS